MTLACRRHACHQHVRGSETSLEGLGDALCEGAHGGRDRGINGDRLPLTAHVVLAAVCAANHRAAQGGARGILDQHPGQHSHRAVVAVGLIRLQQSEIRVVRGVHALVAEHHLDAMYTSCCKTYGLR